MKNKLVLGLLLLTTGLGAQADREALWFFGGVHCMDKKMTAISTSYGADHYSLMNFPTCRAQFFARGEFHYIDISGFFYWTMALNKQNTSEAGFNVFTHTDRSMTKIQDRIGFQYLEAKLRNPDNNITVGRGWQIGTRRFGFTDYGLLKLDLTTPMQYPDPGPYSSRQTLFVGLNGQYFMSLPYLQLRGGIYANALIGVQKYGVMVYPEFDFIAHFWKIGIVAEVAYEAAYLYTPTANSFKSVEPAKTSGLVYGLRFDLGIAFDLNMNK